MTKKQKSLSGIIAVTEVYETERTPSIWLCDTQKLDAKKHANLIKGLSVAINDPTSRSAVISYDDGFQGEPGDVAAVQPPCYITDHVTLYAE